MAIDNFIPQVWAASILENLGDAHVFGSVVNRDYEGEIKAFGDSVRINSVGRPTISSYTKNVTTVTPETPQGSGQTLVIDQAKYFAFEVDDIDAVQQKPKVMGELMKEAAWGLAETADTYLAALINAAVQASTNDLGAKDVGIASPEILVYDLIVDMWVKLRENNVPMTDNWVVLPPWMEGMLRKDARFVGYGTPQNFDIIRGAPIGNIQGMNVYISNNLVKTDTNTNVEVLAGWKGAVTFAEEIPPGQPEAYRPENAFSDALKGLHLYGATVTRPNAIVVATCTND